MRFLRRLILIFLVLVFALPAGFRLAAILRESETVAQALPAEGRLVETALGRIFVLEEGPADGPVLLFAHGTAAWSGLWHPTLQAAGAEGFRAIAFDMPPFGYSDRAADADYGRVRQAERVQALVEALEIRPIVVAHSFGAGPMVEAVMRAPEAFEALIVVDGALGLGSHESPAELPLPLRPAPLRQAAISLTATNPFAMRPILRSLIHVDEAATPEIADLLRQPMRRQGTTAAYSDWVPSLLVPPQDALSTRAESYAALSLPTAYIWGAEDTVTPPSQGQELAAATRGAMLLFLANVGHIPQIEDPGAFQRVLFIAIRSMTGATQ